ncbi:MAG: hypothetical protein JKY88_16490 [Pseudomonadales bacterium]|nr:hypothetical protein [Pseudomonadales bacterium]
MKEINFTYKLSLIIGVTLFISGCNGGKVTTTDSRFLAYKNCSAAINEFLSTPAKRGQIVDFSTNELDLTSFVTLTDGSIVYKEYSDTGWGLRCQKDKNSIALMATWRNEDTYLNRGILARYYAPLK